MESWNVGVLNIEGLDAEAGYSRFGTEDIYKEVLRSFMVYTPDLVEKLRQVEKETLPEYAIAVHGLKGSSYGICANKVGKMAEALEFAAKSENIETVKEKNGDLLREVDSLLSALRALWKDSPSEDGSAGRKSAPDAPLLRELGECCARYDVTGMEKALSKLERYTYESQDDLIKWLRKQVDNLEYEQILERLREAGCV
jgi:HPt (histidine-containing phosphotransfer) domain-containing protein